MALNKEGVDIKAIERDQKAIDKLPNKGRAFYSAKSKALAKKMGKKETRPLTGKGHKYYESIEHDFTK